MTRGLTTEGVMRAGPVMAVLTIERTADAVPLARALLSGGLKVLEVTLRTAAALEAIKAIAGEVPEAIVGAGTVLTPADWDAAQAAGARFIVSPGLTEPLIAAASGNSLPFLPGVATSSELMRGLDAGLTRFKFFPAEAAGGPAMLKAFAGPFGACQFCPTGGVTEANASAYLNLANVVCVGGGWVAPSEAINQGDWARIAALASAARRL